jgi:hypothetical protein
MGLFFPMLPISALATRLIERSHLLSVLVVR